MQKSTSPKCWHWISKLFVGCMLLYVGMFILGLLIFTIDLFAPLSVDQTDWIVFGGFIFCVCGLIYFVD